MDTLQLDKQKIDNYFTLSLQEYDKLCELLFDVKAVIALFTLFDEETIKPSDLAFFKELADEGYDCLLNALAILNKKQ